MWPNLQGVHKTVPKKGVIILCPPLYSCLEANWNALSSMKLSLSPKLKFFILKLFWNAALFPYTTQQFLSPMMVILHSVSISHVLPGIFFVFLSSIQHPSQWFIHNAPLLGCGMGQEWEFFKASWAVWWMGSQDYRCCDRVPVNQGISLGSFKVPSKDHRITVASEYRCAWNTCTEHPSSG
jgi:hypothetical protein